MLSAQLSHSGPLPDPAQLAHYDRVLPGLAERIVLLTEREQKHRHDLSESFFKRQARLKDRGQVLGFASLIILLGFCVFLAFIGEPGWASKVAIGVIAAVVGIFVIGKWGDRKEAADDEASAD